MLVKSRFQRYNALVGDDVRDRSLSAALKNHPCIDARLRATSLIARLPSQMFIISNEQPKNHQTIKFFVKRS